MSVLATLFAISAITQIVFSLSSPSYALFGVFFFLLSVYLAVGFIRGWNHARVSAWILMILMLLMAVLNLAMIKLDPVAAAEIPERQRIPFVVKNFARLLLLPVITWYLFRPNVRLFFKRASAPSATA